MPYTRLLFSTIHTESISGTLRSTSLLIIAFNSSLGVAVLNLSRSSCRLGRRGVVLTSIDSSCMELEVGRSSIGPGLEVVLLLVVDQQVVLAQARSQQRDRAQARVMLPEVVLDFAVSVVGRYVQIAILKLWHMNMSHRCKLGSRLSLRVLGKKMSYDASLLNLSWGASVHTSWTPRHTDKHAQKLKVPLLLRLRP